VSTFDGRLPSTFKCQCGGSHRHLKKCPSGDFGYGAFGFAASLSGLSNAGSWISHSSLYGVRLVALAGWQLHTETEWRATILVFVFVQFQREQEAACCRASIRFFSDSQFSRIVLMFASKLACTWCKSSSLDLRIASAEVAVASALCRS